MRLAVVGSYGAGLTMRVPRMPEAGETLPGGLFAAGPGGKGSNQAIGAARLGAEVSFLTAVGPDAFGQEARRLWEAESVDATVVEARAATMVGVILVEEGGENRIVIAPGALDELRPEHVAAFAPRIAAADLVLVCNEIPQDVVSATLRTARAHGVRTLLNPAPARELPAGDRALVDVLTPNLGEARVLTGLTGSEPGELLDALRAAFPATTIVLTCGPAGAYVDDGAERFHVGPVPPGRVVDTTGAGDAFTAALAVSIDRPLREAVRFAAAGGAHAVSQHEAIPGLGRIADLEALLKGADS
ncbi:ribokinase [Nonomuraea soli]|uniref:Ribokinase n=1 Tax=Nonomuraea soli TaxID=1032476 RepID=A0A7W0CMJ1_9ACTN|nr:ribokinase [Nonomuraea soli]MBA2893732.1 ribokinase [Nonomuraea soli]